MRKALETDIFDLNLLGRLTGIRPGNNLKPALLCHVVPKNLIAAMKLIGRQQEQPKTLQVV